MLEKLDAFLDSDNGKIAVYTLLGLIIGLIVGCFLAPENVNILSHNGNGNHDNGNDNGKQNSLSKN